MGAALEKRMWEKEESKRKEKEKVDEVVETEEQEASTSSSESSFLALTSRAIVVATLRLLSAPRPLRIPKDYFSGPFSLVW